MPTVVVRAAGLMVAALMSSSNVAMAQGLDVRGWLDRPGVKLLAVEFYATWCKPCMAAVPRWEELRQKYAAQGLRLIVVSTRDPGGVCANPGWTPDDIVCDPKGVVADALGAASLPAAYLWSWQGNLLVRSDHIDEVDAAIQRWMNTTSRVLVQVERAKGSGMSRRTLLNLVRDEMAGEDKITVVATETERRAMHRQLARVLDDPTYREGMCVGDDLPPNSILKAGVADGQLYLKLLSMKSGCLVKSAVVRWSKGRSRVRVREAVAALLSKLRAPPQMPGAARSSRRTPPARDRDISEEPRAWEPAQGAEEVIVGFESDPPGAVVMSDGQLLCQSTEGGCSKALTVGSHTIAMHLERYEKRSSEPPGREVKVNGKVIGATPVADHELAPGAYEVVIDDRCFYKKGKRITLTRGDRKTLDLSLSPRQGAIKVTAEDSKGNAVAADVFVDGEPLGKTPGTFKVSVCAKKVEVKSQTGSWSRDLSVPKRKTVRLKAVLQEERASGGMVRVPAGDFWMGCADHDKSCEPDEKPGRTVYLDAFRIDRTEVTVAQYAACVRDGKCSAEGLTGGGCNWGHSGREAHPINCVDWRQARTYCGWAGKRLPTEAQWEKAARGTDGRVYPWGNARASCRYAVMDDGGNGCGTGGTMPVGSKRAGKSPYGALDMTGNLFEWTADSFDSYAKAPRRNPTGAARGSGRVFRGGCWFDGEAQYLRASLRYRDGPEYRSGYLGFRCARPSS